MLLLMYTITALFTPPILLFDSEAHSAPLSDPWPSNSPSNLTSDPRPNDSPSDPPSDPHSDPPSDISMIFSETISFLVGSSNIFFDEAKIQLVTPSPEPLEISPLNPNSRQWRLESFLDIFQF